MPPTPGLLRSTFKRLCRTLHVHHFIAGDLPVCEVLCSGSPCAHATRSKRMGALHLSLALILLFSSPVRAQWWSLIWANPKTSINSAPLSVTSPFVTSAVTSDTPASTEWLATENGVAEKALEDRTQTEGSVLTPTPSPGGSIFGHDTTESGTLPPEESAGGVSKARAKHKPLKHWKSGECDRVDIRACCFHFRLRLQPLKEKLISCEAV